MTKSLSLLAAFAMLSIAYACSPEDPHAANGGQLNPPSPNGPTIQDADATHSNFAVLVDLSATWHNERDRIRNERLLRSVAQALPMAAERGVNLMPARIRYHLIGRDTLYAEPLCATSYGRFLMPRPGVMGTPEKLDEYLTTCVRAAMSRPPQEFTEITAAIKSAVSVMSDPAHPDLITPRRIIILSDMLEDLEGTAPELSAEELAGVDILLLYRALPEDRRDPSRLQRIEDWSQRLRTLGARVVALTDVDRTPTDLAELLKKDFPQ